MGSKLDSQGEEILRLFVILTYPSVTIRYCGVAHSHQIEVYDESIQLPQRRSSIADSGETKSAANSVTCKWVLCSVSGFPQCGLEISGSRDGASQSSIPDLGEPRTHNLKLLNKNLTRCRGE